MLAIEPEFKKFRDKILFPEKLKKVNKML